MSEKQATRNLPTAHIVAGILDTVAAKKLAKVLGIRLDPLHGTAEL